jgi:hypothetical protein
MDTSRRLPARVDPAPRDYERFKYSVVTVDLPWNPSPGSILHVRLGSVRRWIKIPNEPPSEEWDNRRTPGPSLQILVDQHELNGVLGSAWQQRWPWLRKTRRDRAFPVFIDVGSDKPWRFWASFDDDEKASGEKGASRDEEPGNSERPLQRAFRGHWGIVGGVLLAVIAVAVFGPLLLHVLPLLLLTTLVALIAWYYAFRGTTPPGAAVTTTGAALVVSLLLSPDTSLLRWNHLFGFNPTVNVTATDAETDISTGWFKTIAEAIEDNTEGTVDAIRVNRRIAAGGFGRLSKVLQSDRDVSLKTFRTLVALKRFLTTLRDEPG